MCDSELIRPIELDSAHIGVNNCTVAYDAQYLALAEQTGAEFWTADKRLADRARRRNARWVKWIQD